MLRKAKKKPETFFQIFLDKFVNLYSTLFIPKELFDKHSDAIHFIPLTEIRLPYKTEQGGYQIFLGRMFRNHIISMHILLLHMNQAPLVQEEMLAKHYKLLTSALYDFFAYHYKEPIGETYKSVIEDLIIESIRYFDQLKYKKWLLTYSMIGLIETKPVSLKELKKEGQDVNFFRLNAKGEVTYSGWFKLFFKGEQVCLALKHKDESGEYKLSMLSRIREATFDNLDKLKLSEKSALVMYPRLYAVWNNLARKQFKRFAKKSKPALKQFTQGLLEAVFALTIVVAVFMLCGTGVLGISLAVLPSCYAFYSAFVAWLKCQYQREILPQYRREVDITQDDMLALLYKEYIPKAKPENIVLDLPQANDTQVSTYVLQNESAMRQEVDPSKVTHHRVKFQLAPDSKSKIDQMREAAALERQNRTVRPSVVDWRQKGRSWQPSEAYFPIKNTVNDYGYISPDALYDLTKNISNKKAASLRADLQSGDPRLFTKVHSVGHSGVVYEGDNNAKLKLEGKLGNVRVDAVLVAKGPNSERLFHFYHTDLNSHAQSNKKVKQKKLISKRMGNS